MRHELLDPLKGNARYEVAQKLVRRIYRLIDAGKDCSEALARLGKVVRNKRISTLIQSPELYFGDPNRARILSAPEILDTALAAKGRGEPGLTNG